MKHTLEEERAVETNALGGEGFLDRCTVGSGVDGAVFGGGGFIGWHRFVCKVVELQRGMGEEENWRGRVYINQPNAIGCRTGCCTLSDSWRSRPSPAARMTNHQARPHIAKREHRSAHPKGQLPKFARSHPAPQGFLSYFVPEPSPFHHSIYSSSGKSPSSRSLGSLGSSSSPYCIV